MCLFFFFKLQNGLSFNIPVFGNVTLHSSRIYFRCFERLCRCQLQDLKVRSSLNLGLESLNVSFSSKRLGIIHGRTYPYQILGNFDYAAVRLETDAYLNTCSPKVGTVCSLWTTGSSVSKQTGCGPEFDYCQGFYRLLHTACRPIQTQIE